MNDLVHLLVVKRWER